jgi:hypothetical protein
MTQKTLSEYWIIAVTHTREKHKNACFSLKRSTYKKLF